MTEATINYKHHALQFYNLLDEGYNMDKFIQDKSLYTRSDHNFDPLLAHLSSGSIVYDIGAYIGTFSIPMALEGMTVVAFEGFPDNVRRLKKNCEAYPNIEVYEAALSNKNNEIVTQFNDCMDQEVPQETLIKYVLLDEFIKENKIPLPNFIKMDIEGMETLALFGMTNLIKNVKPVWQLCYHYEISDKYEHYPGFVATSDGGFDFSTLFEDYIILLNGNRILSFNQWGEYLMIPKDDS